MPRIVGTEHIDGSAAPEPSGQVYIGDVDGIGLGAFAGGGVAGVSCMPVGEPGAGVAATGHSDGSPTTEPSGQVTTPGAVGTAPLCAAAAVAAIADGHCEGSVTTVTPSEHV